MKMKKKMMKRKAKMIKPGKRPMMKTKTMKRKY